MKNKNILR